MSSPTRQINGRKLPPIQRYTAANCYNKQPSSRLSLSPNRLHRRSVNDMIVRGHSPLHNVHYGNYLYPQPGISEDRLQSPLPMDASPDFVAQYLEENPDFLERYVVSHISYDQLCQWIARKCPQVGKQWADDNNGETEAEQRRNSIQKWKFGIYSDRRKQVQDLTKKIQNQTDKVYLLVELTNCLIAALHADGANLYLVDKNGQDIHYFKPSSSSSNSSFLLTKKIGSGSTLSAYAAHMKETVRVCDILGGDEKFPEGVLIGSDRIQAVLAHPVFSGDGSVMGVVELYRKVGVPPFIQEDEELACRFHVWGSSVIHHVKMNGNMSRQRKLNEFLLTVTKSIFTDIVSMDTVIMKIMKFTQKLVNADRASLFLLDSMSRELYSRIFDVGGSSGCQTEIRFPMDKGVAGHVASTGEPLNIPDAYKDERFNREVDLQTGYTTKTILCMPIYIRGTIIGVIQMVNKLNGTFTKADEESFTTFAVYCGLALHHAKLYEKIHRSEQKYKVALEVLSYHRQCSEEEFRQLQSKSLPREIPNLLSYEFSPWNLGTEQKTLYVLYMFQDLFSITRFEMMDLMRFILTVRKNYRNVPYHNWVHAFSVAHSMYTIIKTASHKFNPTESLALFVACLCHDLDHRGKTNTFMVQSASPLAAIYSTSTMEHHHFNQTVTILQNDGHNIFKHLSSKDYKKVLDQIKHCILATDLALFFGNKARLKTIVEDKQFSWDTTEHRMLLSAIAMTSADLCASAKPWDVQVETVKVIFEEFYAQGDEEKARGDAPMPMMDRDNAEKLPQIQVGFIVGICLPCYELMAHILPETQPLVDGARANMKKWEGLAEKGKKETSSK